MVNDRDSSQHTSEGDQRVEGNVIERATYKVIGKRCRQGDHRAKLQTDWRGYEDRTCMYLYSYQVPDLLIRRI